MSFINCCGCINNNEREIRGKDVKKRYKGNKPEKKPIKKAKSKNSSNLNREEDPKFNSV
jgi:hypothetical protein